jgi:hypothetical protein
VEKQQRNALDEKESQLHTQKSHIDILNQQVEAYQEEMVHLEEQCSRTREIGELAGLAVGADRLLALEVEVVRLRAIGGQEPVGVLNIETVPSYREECLLSKIEDLSAALIRVQLKLEETNSTCQHLAIQAAITVQNEQLRNHEVYDVHICVYVVNIHILHMYVYVHL